MNVKLAGARVETSLKLDESRNELRHLLHDEIGEPQPKDSRAFPRSKTVKFLTSSKAIGVLAIAAAGVLIMRPRVATRLLRLVPASSMARMLAMRFFVQNGRRHER